MCEQLVPFLAVSFHATPNSFSFFFFLLSKKLKNELNVGVISLKVDFHCGVKKIEAMYERSRVK